MQLNFPNLLTFIRIALIPIFGIVFFQSFSWVNILCSALFGIAALTDLLDGYIARKLGQTSAFGAFLDPVADKLMITVALVLLVKSFPTPLMATTAIIIIGREITISALREWMASVGKSEYVSVSAIGKAKTFCQMLAVLLLLYREPLWVFPTMDIGLTLLVVAAGLTLFSMFQYLSIAIAVLRYS